MEMRGLNKNARGAVWEKCKAKTQREEDGLMSAGRKAESEVKVK